MKAMNKFSSVKIAGTVMMLCALLIAGTFSQECRCSFAAEAGYSGLYADHVKKMQDGSSGISVTLNGRSLVFDQPPIIVDNRTLVPLRVIFESMGASVDWDQETETVTSRLGDTSISLKLGSSAMYKNGEEIHLDVPAQIVNQRTLVPVRAISEAFGADVEWDGNTGTVVIKFVSTDAADSADAADTARAYIGRSVSELTDAIGMPLSWDYASSCLGSGEDGILSYDGFTVYTYRENGMENVVDVE